MDEDGIGFELVAASLRSGTQDVKTFMPVLAEKLSGALPQQTQVRYRGGLMGKKTVQAIEVDLGEARYRIEENHGRLSPSRQKVVRSIVLKNEPLPLDVWIEDLSRTMAEAADASETGRAALQQMLEGS
ncbi:MAG TPA: hypothetical protein VFB34_02970 [Chloroflexota bacterium]|nr:hypothetical protein [Chloroflexota bacterium]